MLVWTIEKDESPLSASQPRPINVMCSFWLKAAVRHRLSPFRAVGGDEQTELVPTDDMTGFMNYGLVSILGGSPRPQGD
jgi:hypothetical protein